MGSKRIGGVWFQVYSGEHPGSLVPHVHAKFNEGEVALELLADGSVRFSEAHREPIDAHVKQSDVRRALRVAFENHSLLVALWKGSRP